MKTPRAAGPARYNRIWVRKYGPSTAKTILVLVPGSPSGQSTFSNIAPALVTRVPGLAVWTVDRRANALEDISGFQLGDADAALTYYSTIFDPVTDAQGAFVRKWGLKVEVNDVHKVVRAARAGGHRRVILGGHSMGASLVPSYAAWDFHGRAGYRDLSGMVLIDGGQYGVWLKYLKGTVYAPPITTAKQAKRALHRFGHMSPFGIAGTPLGAPLWLTGVLPELACQYALQAPQAPSTLQSFAAFVEPFLPPGTLPAFPVTNEAFMGYLLTHTKLVPALHVRVGQLAASGDPRAWVNGPFSGVPTACASFAQEPGNAMEWYYPARLDLDLMRGAQYLRDTPAARKLGLRLTHAARINVPLFAFQTSLSEGGTFRGAKRFARATRIPRLTLAGNENMGHLDPLLDYAGNNTFVTTVVPFLKGIVRRAP